MAQNICAVCTRMLRRQSAVISQTYSASPKGCARTFMTTRPRRDDGAIPSVTPRTTKHASKSDAQTLGLDFKRLLANKQTVTYSSFGVTELLYKECAKQASYTIPKPEDEDVEMPKTADGEDLGVGEGWWHTELGLQPTFSTWSQVTMLHLYVLSARFRNIGTMDAQPFQQHLLDHFFYDAEHRMAVNHNMTARGTRNKYLKDLYVQWRGLIAAYDEGIFKGDAVLAAAIWRNIFKAKEDVDIKGLAMIVSYTRRLLSRLDALSDEALASEKLEFGNPTDEEKVVNIRSAMLDLPFTASEKSVSPAGPPAGKQI
ncbi:ubiquinol-cytochrome C chaperone-domain-containing protein [Bisporella sp. PMI_857]|nr:ubiquinol-cytochrome C chaperone-domain-containing protein [Bisporella sp. PMI_857]